MSEAEPIEAAELTGLQYGSYRLVQPLGSGGMSSVYRAVHVETATRSRSRSCPSALAKNPIVLQRFLREARSAESLEHPNIVSIYDRGIDRAALPGPRVRPRRRPARASPRRAPGRGRGDRGDPRGRRGAASTRPSRGLIHRDIKPSNILRSAPRARSRSSTWAWPSRPTSRTSGSRARGRPSARSTTWPRSRRGTAARPASRATSTRWAARSTTC